MSRKAKEKQEAPRTLPSVAEIEEALAWFCARAQKPVTTTFILKARKPSRQTKVPQLLDKHIYVTNLKHRILEHYRERLDRQRDDGAIALVLRAQQLGKGRDQALGEIIEKEYVRPGLTDEDYRYHARLRQDTCTDVARILIGWVQNITGTVLSRATLKTGEDKEAESASTQASSAPRKKQKRSAIRRLSRQKRDHPMMMEEAYAAWKQKRQRWERTAAIPIPFGRHEETPLGDIGRREARWLMERLLPVDEIQKTLEFVEHLIQDPDARAEEIAYEEHPYIRDSGREFKHHRAVHANRLLQRLLDPPGDLVLLGMLHKNELEDVRNDLQMMKNAGEQLASLLPPFHEALREAQQLAEFSDFEDQAFKNFREVFETFLYEKPDDYPEIPAVTLTDENAAELLGTYQTRLNWFRPDRKRKNDVDKYVEEKLETGARHRLLQAHGALQRPSLQPIPFTIAMRPARYHQEKKTIISASYRGFALLFDEATYDYVVALWMRGSKDPLSPAEQQERQEKQRHQKHQGRLRYANFPETRFEPSDATAYMLLPLEWGERSNRRRFREQRQPLLRQIIDQQREKQQALHKTISTEDNPVPIELCLPNEVPFSSARLVMEWNEQGEPEFFLHMPVTTPADHPEQIPQTVMGFHEHDAGYSFAELELDGTVISMDDLAIPKHVDPAQGARRSDNYQYEVAHAILRQAGTAYIGLESTGWKKGQPELSRAHNRMVFGRPSVAILKTLQDKGRQSRVLEPREVTGVSPAYECHACGVQQPETSRCLERRVFVRCPMPDCQTRQLRQMEDVEQRCIRCDHVWKVEAGTIDGVQYFVCPTCQHPALPARYNTAIVVAKATLCQLIPHYKNAKKRDEERLKRIEQRKQAAQQGAAKEEAPATDNDDADNNEA